MRRMQTTRVLGGSAALIGTMVLLGLSVTGCRQADDEVDILTLQGKVEKIDAKPDGTGTVTISYYNEKHGEDMIGTGAITRETEIMINGVMAGIGDLQVGDQARGEVRIDKRGKERRQIAVKIYVDRAEPAPKGD